VSHLSDKHCLRTHNLVVQIGPNLCGDVVFEPAPSNSGVTPTKQQKQRRRPYDRKEQYINPLGKIQSLIFFLKFIQVHKSESFEQSPCTTDNHDSVHVSVLETGVPLTI
jgi:hypothetical protein